ncbi:MAG TPA: toll/interleukin-1 receptor domain-containing protein [Steroidobacteraceae bacterium]|nr:toll/interleukin-1 receptor domain-containing protein [Steroidobacteraceae bacterium]
MRAVFVSYSQADRDTATALVAHVEGAGLPCWVAPRDVAPGADWAEAIVDAIAASRVMVLVFSASTNSSPQVRREVERAVHRGVTVLPFRVEDVLPARSLEYFLSTQHWLDAFPPPMERHYERLCAYLKPLLVGGSPATDFPAAGTAPVPRPSMGGETLPGSVPRATLGAAALASPETLQRLEAELARYIGPVARHLVSRAALHSAGVEALILELGGEIDSEVDRRRFLEASRRSLQK